VSGQFEFGDEDRSVALPRVWGLCLHLLATKVSKVTFSSYVETAHPLSYIGNTVTLGVTSPFAMDWLEKKAANAIRSALEFHLDTTGLQIKFVVMTREQRAGEKNAHARRTEPVAAKGGAQTMQPTLPLDGDLPGSAEPQSETPPPANPPAPLNVARPASPNRGKGGKTESKPAPRPPIPCLPLNDRYLFDNFLIGRSNRLAHAGATNVAARPSEIYNPLFLYGGPGLGKTHLLQGIAHHLKMTRPEMRVAYVSGEYFAQTYITAIREHATEEFRRQYRDVDVWLVDDIQFVAGKEHTKEEFFHTFNALYQNGKQIVIASDRSPRDLNTMDERLRSRFQSGLIADIGAPELETRIAILQQCRLRENAEVDDEVLDYIGSAIQSNIRALEGALTRLIAYSSIMNVPATAELAQSVLKEYFIDKPIRQRKITIDEIVEAVGEQFGITGAALKGPNRNKDVSLARQVAMYICRELMPELNTTVTGEAFGGRDHATIVYACQRVKALREVDTELKALITQLIKKLSC
jgi:chromosomal replication initiator protein